MLELSWFRGFDDQVNLASNGRRTTRTIIFPDIRREISQGRAQLVLARRLNPGRGLISNQAVEPHSFPGSREAGRASSLLPPAQDLKFRVTDARQRDINQPVPTSRGIRQSRETECFLAFHPLRTPPTRPRSRPQLRDDDRQAPPQSPGALCAAPSPSMGPSNRPRSREEKDGTCDRPCELHACAGRIQADRCLRPNRELAPDEGSEEAGSSAGQASRRDGQGHSRGMCVSLDTYNQMAANEQHR